MNDTDRIDKEAGLIKLTVGQVCSAGIGHNIYTGDHKFYATPFMHKVQEMGADYFLREKAVGLAIRIANDGAIIGNPRYTGNAIIAFLPEKYATAKIHTCRITRVNRRSVNIEPLEYETT